MTVIRRGSPGFGRAVLAWAIGAVVALGAGFAQAQGVVGGVTPDRRPTEAPVQAKPSLPDGYDKWARRGVSEPVPATLKFIKDHGGWYTPFDHRGMPGRYDLRGLHGMPASADGAKAKPLRKKSKVKSASRKEDGPTVKRASRKARARAKPAVVG